MVDGSHTAYVQTEEYLLHPVTYLGTPTIETFKSARGRDRPLLESSLDSQERERLVAVKHSINEKQSLKFQRLVKERLRLVLLL